MADPPNNPHDAYFRLEGRDAFVYVLIEHQSRPDSLMAFRMLEYTVRIWNDYIRNNPRPTLCPPSSPWSSTPAPTAAAGTGRLGSPT
ncbi:hypothetical protein D7D52_16580 [Nocardia yunnanensis]|uniref:Transposase (putative) YhgA-like domain-containing protein n=1 Tax=Nocardia yunnanensis TaxID=2382165 RepID=A0A386ZBI2_9NOCA|nr:hypothetical protein D7D52_16580 [Nocardia yunnanensis]